MNKVSLSLQGTLCAANDKISALKQNSFPILRDISGRRIGDDINQGEFLILYNKFYRPLEDLPDSVNQYVLNDQCISY